MSTRTPRIPQSTPQSDIVRSNNTDLVVGVSGYPINGSLVPGGVFFVDPYLQVIQVQAFGGSLVGTPGNAVVIPTTSDLDALMQRLVVDLQGLVVTNLQGNIVTSL
jgi:hypothetical protein